MPPGELGNLIVLKVADILQKLYLYDDSIILLQNRFENTAFSPEKLLAIKKIAEMQLQAHKTHDAAKIIEENLEISALNLYNANKIPVIHDIRYIYANILLEKRNFIELVNFLHNDFSYEADKILSNLYWNKREFKSFSDFSEPYLYSIRNLKEKLNLSQENAILRQSIAYAQDKNYNLMGDFLNNFKGRMRKDSYNFASSLLRFLAFNDHNGLKNLSNLITKQ